MDGMRHGGNGGARTAFVGCGRAGMKGRGDMVHLDVAGAWGDAECTTRKGVWADQNGGEMGAYTAPVGAILDEDATGGGVRAGGER